MLKWCKIESLIVSEVTMDALYYTSGFLMSIIILVTIIFTIIILIKPHVLNKRRFIKKPFSRLKIITVAVLVLLFTTVGFGTVLGATEPESVKQSRVLEASNKLKAEEKNKTEAMKIEADNKAKEASKPQVKTETAVEAIAFAVTNQETNTLDKGVTKVSVVGQNGEQTTTFSVTYVNGLEAAREIVKKETTVQPINQVNLVGTYIKPVAPKAADTKCNPNYSGCVPNVSYDLDCPDIGYKVQVLGYDQYRLDANKDGFGCDSY